MIGFILGLLMLLFGSTGSIAQGCGPTNPNCVVPTAPAGTRDNRAASTAFVGGSIDVDVTNPQFGAKCNNDATFDDAPGINAAIAYAVALGGGEFGLTSVTITSPTGSSCTVKSTVNLTNIATRPGFMIALGRVECVGNNTWFFTCFDARGSKYLQWNNTRIGGSCNVAQAPGIGIQIGRATPAAGSTEGISFFRPVMFGCFIFANIYNFGSEITSYFDPHLNNEYCPTADNPSFCNGTVSNPVDGRHYILVNDGCNIFNVPSLSGANPPSPTIVSFNENEIYGGRLGVRGTNGVPVFACATHRHKYIRSYFCGACEGIGTPSHGMIVYNAAGNGTNIDLDVDAHLEGNMPDFFFITGTHTTPSMTGFRYLDHLNQSTVSVFNADSSVFPPGVSGNSITINDTDIRIAQSVAGITLLGTGFTGWHMTGHVSLPSSITMPNASLATFSGILCQELIGCRAWGTGTLSNPGVVIGNIDGNGIFSPQPFSMSMAVNGTTAFSILSGGFGVFGGGPVLTLTNGQVIPFWAWTDEGNVANNYARSSAVMAAFNTTLTWPPTVYISKMHNNILGNFGAVLDTEKLGTVEFQGSNAVTTMTSASIESAVNGTPGSGSRNFSAATGSVSVDANGNPIGGLGYVVGNTLTAAGGTCTITPTWKVATVCTGAGAPNANCLGAGQVITVSVDSGGICSVPPSSSQNAVTGGAGTGVKLDFFPARNTTSDGIPANLSLRTGSTSSYAVFNGTTIGFGGPTQGVGTGYCGGGTCDFDVTAALNGGTCGTLPVVNVHAVSGIPTTINSITTAGACTVWPANPNPVTCTAGCGGGGTGLYLNIQPASLISAIQIDSTQNVFLASGAIGSELATNAITGFPLIPTVNGPPTGNVPVVGNGHASLVIDRANKKICYSVAGGTWECSGAFTP